MKAISIIATLLLAGCFNPRDYDEKPKQDTGTFMMGECIVHITVTTGGYRLVASPNCHLAGR